LSTAEYGNTVPKQALLIPIHIISTIHSLTSRSDFIFVPLRSFTVQQQVCMGVADQEPFARQAYLEFAHCVGVRSDEDVRNSRPPSPAGILSSQQSNSPNGCQRQRGSLRRSSEEGRISSSTPEKWSNSPSGAIAVSNHISVDISDAMRSPAKQKKGDSEIGTTARASAAAVETETYVDKLVALCRG
jgi:hypothetical protein